MRIWYASIFLSLLAGKLHQIEQSAGVTQFMKFFKRSKSQIMQRQQTLNQRMCKRQKVRLSIFSTLTVDKFDQKHTGGATASLLSTWA